MPGLLNHLTGTLDQIEMSATTETDANGGLLKTIKLPMRMGQITERLPEPQYDNESKLIKRSNSQPSSVNGKPSILQKPPRAELGGSPSPSITGGNSPASVRSSGSQKYNKPLPNLADKAHRNINMPIITENAGDEDETLRANKPLYRPQERVISSRDSAIKRKNNGIIGSAANAKILPAHLQKYA